MVQSRTLALFTSYKVSGKSDQGVYSSYLGGVIPPETQIGEGTFFTYHALGVVVNGRTIIGQNCKIRQNVTIGANGDGAPVIGDNVQIGAGAVLIGNIHIGNNVIIGANAFVNTDLPENCTAVGLPAKAIKFHKPET